MVASIAASPLLLVCPLLPDPLLELTPLVPLVPPLLVVPDVPLVEPEDDELPADDDAPDESSLDPLLDLLASVPPVLASEGTSTRFSVPAMSSQPTAHAVEAASNNAMR